MGFKHSSIIKTVAVACIGGSVLTACATPDPDAAFEDLTQAVAGRVPEAVVWRTGGPEDTAVDARVDALLSEPLTAQTAVQVALLNNRGLQARYAALGIAQAELVQAGLLENPVFEIMVRPSTEHGTNIELGLMQNLVDLLMRPARQRLAEAEYEAAKLELAAHLVEFVGDVESTYHAHRGALGVREVVQEIANTARDGDNLAQAFHTAGNITELELVTHQAEAEDAQTELFEAEEHAKETRIELAEILGIDHSGEWSVPTRPPSLPEQMVALNGLEARALRNRFDLAAHRAEVQAAIEELGLEEDFRLMEEAELSVSAEREPEGEWLIGPALEFPLPLFDQGQARVSGAAMALRQARDLLISEETHIKAEVHKSADAMSMARQRAAHLQRTVLPLKERIVRLTLLEYNYMLEGPFHLLEAQQEQNETYKSYVEALTEYWMARAKLQAAVGGGSLESNSQQSMQGDAS